MIERPKLRRAAALLAVIALMALPAAAFAHPGHDSTAVPTTDQQTPSDSGGGASPLLIAGIVVGVLALAGGLYAGKELQKRPPQPAAEQPPTTAEPKPAAAPIADHRGVSPEAGA